MRFWTEEELRGCFQTRQIEVFRTLLIECYYWSTMFVMVTSERMIYSCIPVDLWFANELFMHGFANELLVHVLLMCAERTCQRARGKRII